MRKGLIVRDLDVENIRGLVCKLLTNCKEYLSWKNFSDGLKFEEIKNYWQVQENLKGEFSIHARTCTPSSGKIFFSYVPPLLKIRVDSQDEGKDKEVVNKVNEVYDLITTFLNKEKISYEKCSRE